MANEAKNWWHNNLSHNQQEELATKHLDTFSKECLVGSFVKYTSGVKYNECIEQIWEAEGRPEGLKPEGYTW